MTGEEWRFCKKCLIRDLDDEALLFSVKEYIAGLDPDIKTTEKEYNRRLAICADCEKLVRGTCIVCGCYVEMRAAGKDRSCPEASPRW